VNFRTSKNVNSLKNNIRLKFVTWSKTGKLYAHHDQTELLRMMKV